MKREESIAILDGFKHNPLFNGQHFEALDMAISALSENKGDLISRQAVLDGIAEWIVSGYADSEADCSHISSLVTHLPSVESKGEWIPVSERLPKAYQKILVTYEEFHWANEPMTYGVKLISFGGVVDFIAWQPLPEPYQKGGE